jgi:putative acetyltransferase
MTQNDFEEVRILWKDSGIELSQSDDINELKRMILHNPNYCLVIESEKKIIGAVLGGFDGRRGWIHHLAIHPSHQKMGYGKLLLDALILAFETDNVIKIKLEVLESNNKVIEFYKKLGWDLRKEITTMSLNLPR